MKKRKRPFALLAFAAAFCLAFTGCGSDDDDDDDESEAKKPKASITVSDDESDPDEGSEQDESSKEISPDSGNGTESLADTQQDSQPDESKEESVPDQSAPDSSAPDSAPDSVPDIPQGVAITDKDIIGTWTAIEVNSRGNVTKPMEGVVNGYFYDDHTGGLENTKNDEWEDFEWKISDTTVTLDQDGEAVSGSVKADGTLVIGNDKSVITFKKLGSSTKKRGGDSSTPDKPVVPSKGDKLTESAVIGHWKSTALYSDGEMHYDDDPTYGEIIVELLKMDIQSGGKGTVTSAGDSEDLEWSIKGDKLELTVDGESIYAISSNGQLLIDFDEDGSTVVYLDKVK